MNDKGDALVITGRSRFVTSAVRCTEFPPGDSQPLQDGVVIDPGGQRATRVTTLIVMATSTDGIVDVTMPLKPGTRITNVIAAGAGAIDGQAYNRYRGTVE